MQKMCYNKYIDKNDYGRGYMKIRLKDIADATGYSVNTISHALRDEPDISEATKARIRQVAQELDYIPNLHASTIKSGKSGIISIILPDIINPHFTIVFHEIEQFFRKHKITPFFMNTNENAEEEVNAVRLSIAQNVDGVIICPTQKTTESIRILERSGVPFVLIGRHFNGNPDTNYVVCDDENGAYIATEYLLSIGHRAIAYIRPNEQNSSNEERLAGYRRALREYGVPFDEGLLLNLCLKGGDNSRAIESFLTEHPECTAVLAFNDMIAYETIRVLRVLGRAVPDEISVMGFDNICSDYTFPTMLSSISVSKKHMAQVASELLFEQMSQGKKDAPVDSKKTQIVLPTRLFAWETTTKCPPAKQQGEC